MQKKNKITVGLAQISPIWLSREGTTIKIIKCIEQAKEKGCDFVAFGEAFLPGYPFWIERTEGAKFNSQVQKDLHAFYINQAVNIEAGHLKPIQEICKKTNIAIVLGMIELANDRGNHSVYCSLAYIDQTGELKSTHRKLMPTYEERLSWAQGDGHGLQVHKLEAFTIGALNCWENWMPLTRTALYGLGEDLHVAIWPGGMHNTPDITRFIALESRSYVISVSGLLRREEIYSYIPHHQIIRENTNKEFISNGGSCIASPTGAWIIEPQAEKEALFIAEIDHETVKEERHNFDVAGHYSRPDITQLTVNRQRQNILNIKD